MGANSLSEKDDFEHYDNRPYQATHNTGGTIMGEDPETSAVNSYLQMWDTENLFVVGGSVYPHHSGYNRSEEHTSELQSRGHLVCRLLLEKKKKKDNIHTQ